MTDIEIQFGPIRRELLSHLEGNILDVGSGTGANFEFFHSNANVIGVEPSEHMLKIANAKLPQKASIKTYNLGVTDPKVDGIIENHSLDYIICTLVLCTIPNHKQAIENFKRWLKPDGKLIILEHIHARQKSRRFLQNVINPVWKIVGDGCNLNRDTDQLIKEIGFKAESETYFKRSLRFYQGIFTLSR